MAKHARDVAASRLAQPPPPPPRETTSAQKRKSLVLDSEEHDKGVQREHIIVAKEDIEETVKNVACGTCLNDKLEVTFTQHQIDTYYTVKCKYGHVIIDTNLTRKPVLPVKEKYYPLTVMLVYSMMVLGLGYDGVNKIVSYLSLKKFKQFTFRRYAKYITEKAIIHTQEI